MLGIIWGGLVLVRAQLPSESDEQKAKHFDERSVRVRSWNEGIAVGDSSREEAGCHIMEREYQTPSWDFVDNSDPVITAATAAEGHENDLIQRQAESCWR
jgi:hypothetical protein